MATTRNYTTDVLGRRNYVEKGKRYIESGKGSNKFQNFQTKSAAQAEITVKKVREESRKRKAEAAPSPSTPKYRGGPEGEGKIVTSTSTASPKYRGGPEGDGKMTSRQSTGPVSRGPMSSSRQPMVKAPMKSATDLSTSSASSLERKPYAYSGEEYRRTVTEGKSQRYRSTPAPTTAPAKKSIVGSIIDRVTQPPKELTPASKKILAETRAEITPVVGALAITRLGYKGIAKGLNKVLGPKSIFYKKPSVPQGNRQPRPIEELMQRGTASKYVPKKVKFPKAVKGRKLTGSGTYTAN